MDILPEPLVFEWDTGNFDKNERQHGVTNKEAEEIFVHKPLLLLQDTVHSKGEMRYQVMGETGATRLLFIVFTVRKRKVRIISARLMDKKERRMYEKAKKI
ncbi:hypothetical protein A3A79_01600 [Candidatus Gottesmanbacteria bacterium RIFCSPLOWO2_01_FULL_43_11b]|uniref:BrnT family toxin n=1 Tax=Candidatus Gottesmanbacteria bacterium RIFCSPLOWO2_01_FULL_43_11b TaxID=1798392 RepID=A0A1F6AGJ7_9BACT|nr:MAG: hypothetical protein A3A79_01600 [Candidatus Gottesmanbacteria bacterium RIFCSPLOWO2_01_FULL_43_11b]